MVFGSPQPHSTKVGWQFGLRPSCVINGGPEYPCQSLPCDPVKPSEQLDILGGVDGSQKKGQLWEGKAAFEENKLCVGVLKEGEQVGCLLNLFYLQSDLLLKKVLGNMFINKMQAICLLEADYN